MLITSIKIWNLRYSTHIIFEYIRTMHDHFGAITILLVQAYRKSNKTQFIITYTKIDDWFVASIFCIRVLGP